MTPNSAVRRLSLFLALLIFVLPGSPLPAKAVPGARPGIVRVRLVTSAGAIMLALDAAHAPKTAANFLAYVDDGRFNDTSFYRAARRHSDPKRGYIQGGIRTDAHRSLIPVAHESTAMTGIKHQDATISMARGGPPGTAMGNFFITVGPTPQMDATANYAGYAAFGHVVQGMDVVKRILALSTGGGSGEMKGQMILKPVTLIRAERIDGAARPTPGPKPWLIKLPDFRKKRTH